LQQGFVGLFVIGGAAVMHTKLDAAGATQALGTTRLVGPKARPFDIQGGVLCHWAGAELRVNPFFR
jgi:hypothetical protein